MNAQVAALVTFTTLFVLIWESDSPPAKAEEAPKAVEQTTICPPEARPIVAVAVIPVTNHQSTSLPERVATTDKMDRQLLSDESREAIGRIFRQSLQSAAHRSGVVSALNNLEQDIRRLLPSYRTSRQKPRLNRDWVWQ